MQFNRVIKNFVIHGSKEERPETTEDWTSRVKNYAHLDTRFFSSALIIFDTEITWPFSFIIGAGLYPV